METELSEDAVEERRDFELDVYSDRIDELAENDEISSAELGFMKGYSVWEL